MPLIRRIVVSTGKRASMRACGAHEPLACTARLRNQRRRRRRRQPNAAARHLCPTAAPSPTPTDSLTRTSRRWIRAYSPPPWAGRRTEKAAFSRRKYPPDVLHGCACCARESYPGQALRAPAPITMRAPSLSAILNWLLRLLPWWSISTVRPASRARHSISNAAARTESSTQAM